MRGRLDVAPDVQAFTTPSGVPFFVAAGFNATGCYGSGTNVDADARLLIAFAAVDGSGGASATLTVGSRRTALAGNIYPYAVFAHSDVFLGERHSGLIFSTILLPFDSAVAAPALAANVSMTSYGNGTIIVNLPLPSLQRRSPTQYASIVVPAGAGPAQVNQVVVRRHEAWQ